MQCPNCKTELVEVNGRYICSECGKEVPLNEVSVGTWGNSDDKLSIHQTPGSANVSAGGASTIEEPTDYIAHDGQPIASTPTPTAQDVPQTASTVVSEVTPSVTQNTPAENFAAKSIIPTDSDLAKADDAFEALDKQIFGQNTEPNPVENPSIPQAYQRGALEVESAGNIDLNNSGVDVTLNSGIYTDPIYEDNLPQEQNQTAGQKPTRPVEMPVSQPEKESRLNLIIIIAGSVLALIFLIAGIIVYSSLSAKAKVPLLQGTMLTDKIVNCDNAGSDENKATCISESFTGCKAAKWTGDFTPISGVNSDFQVMGPVDTACQLKITFRKYVDKPETENKSMSCQVDSGQEFESTLSSLTATNCSGDLAKILYGASAGTDNNDSTGSTSNTPSQTPTPDGGTTESGN